MNFCVLLSSATVILATAVSPTMPPEIPIKTHWLAILHSLGIPAATVDFGTVLPIGSVVEYPEKLQIAKHLDTALEVLRAGEIHIVIKHPMDGRSGPITDLSFR